jgi:hypothetical protein
MSYTYTVSGVRCSFSLTVTSAAPVVDEKGPRRRGPSLLHNRLARLAR